LDSVTPTFTDIKTKLEYYCVYQERCHTEVENKLHTLKVSKTDCEKIIIHLIEHDFLNETRFSQSFARGKHRIKLWGKKRITTELKARNISSYNINLALKEIDDDAYWETFTTLAERQWQNTTEKNQLKKFKKVCDFLLRKGYESDLVYEKLKKMSAES
jgi:regulatory protein